MAANEQEYASWRSHDPLGQSELASGGIFSVGRSEIFF